MRVVTYFQDLGNNLVNGLPRRIHLTGNGVVKRLTPLEQVPAVKEARGTPLFTIADALEQQHAAKGGAL